MLPINQLDQLPKISGIYRVLDGEGQVIYIGQARNLYERWNKGHHKFSQIIDECGLDAHVDWVRLPLWLLNRAENAAVCFYQPKLNKKTPPVV